MGLGLGVQGLRCSFSYACKCFELLNGTRASGAERRSKETGSLQSRKKLSCSSPGGLRALLLGNLATLIPFFRNRELDTAALGEGDSSLGTVADDEDVRKTGGELAVEDVTDVNDVVSTDVTLLVDKGTDTALVTTTSEHDELCKGRGGKTSQFEFFRRPSRDDPRCPART